MARRVVTNADVGRALREMAGFLEMDDVPFKPRAYEEAATAVEASPLAVGVLGRAGDVKALGEIPYVGKSIAEKIVELARHGRIPELEALRKRTPVDYLSLRRVEGLGPKNIRRLWEALRIRTLEDLEAAAREGRIRRLRGFGERKEASILRGLGFAQQAAGRRPLGAVLPVVDEVVAALRGVRGVRDIVVAGSIRRRRDTIGDIDLLAVADDPAVLARAFAALPQVAHVHARGDTKTLVRLGIGVDADLRIVPPESFGAALVYFTGSKAHCVALRTLAIGRKLKLNEYGLWRGTRRLAGRTEADVYAALGLPFIPPELREDRGEIEAARDGTLPTLVEPGDLRGDLQVQTDWSDGADSIATMVETARALGWSYVAITDHTRDLAMSGGSDEAKLRKQATAIRRLGRTLDGFRVLTGAEVNVREDGALDVSDAALAQLDVVGAAVHTHFDLPRAEQTRRLVRAVEHPHVDVLFHPTCRRLGKRGEIDVDLDAVFAAAKRAGTAIEVDGHPERMDLRDEHVRRAVAAGLPLVVDSDAHRAGELRHALDYGVAVARRGWARRADVLNTLPVDGLLACLKNNRRKRRG